MTVLHMTVFFLISCMLTVIIGNPFHLIPSSICQRLVHTI